MRHRLLLLLVLAACSKSGGGASSSPDGVADGKERGPCYGNGTCDQGLVCYSELCVRPPGADCAKVAEKLSGYRLDNYAPRDERARVIAELTAMCTDAMLTADEGRCILEAHARSEIGACPRPLLPELASDPSGCKDLGSHFADLLFAQLVEDGASRGDLERHRDELIAAMDASCADDGWTQPARSCVVDAPTMDAIEKCENVIPEELQRKVKDRLGPLVDRLRQMSRGGSATVPVAPAAATPLPPTP